MSDVITRISQTQCCDPVIDSLLGEAKQQIAALTAKLQQTREERDLTVGHHIAAGQLMDRAIAERDAALKVRDLAREASNRDLQAKRDAESERDRLAAELAQERRKVAEMEPRAAFGDQCWQDQCEGALIEATVVKRLRSLADQRLEVLRAVEWGRADHIGFTLCCGCNRHQSEGHSPDCIVGLAIAGGGAE